MSRAFVHADVQPRWVRFLRAALGDADARRSDVEQRIEQIIADAGIPPALARIVRTISSDAHLMYCERIAVAEELAAHFADGLDAGASSEELAQDFGDDEQASKLIRRAQRRKRSGPGRWFSTGGKIAGIMLLVLLSMYGFLALRFFMGSPSPSHDYLADLNRPVVSTPADDRAWPIYREALLMLDEPPMIHSRRTPRPGEPGWDAVAAYLAQQQDAFERAAEGASRPIFGYEYAFGIAEQDAALFPCSPLASEVTAEGKPLTLISVLFPQLTVMRQFSTVIVDDIHRAAAQGDVDAITRNLVTLLGIAAQAIECPTLIEQLVGYSIATLAIEAFGQLPDDLDWTPAHLEQIDAALARYGGQRRIIPDISGESAMFRDVLQHTYTDDGNGDGRLTAQGLELLNSMVGRSSNWWGGEDNAWYEDALTSALLPAASVMTASRAELQAKYDELIAKLEAEAVQPGWQRVDAVEAEIEQLHATNRWEFFPVTMLMPAISRVFTSADRTTMERDAARVAVAAMQYRLAHGDWPATLDAMLGEHLAAIPLDQYTGKPLGYALRDGRPVIYSVGTDGDDDGGTPAADQDIARMKPKTGRWQDAPEADGDWILWPRAFEPDPLDYDPSWSTPVYEFVWMEPDQRSTNP